MVVKKKVELGFASHNISMIHILDKLKWVHQSPLLHCYALNVKRNYQEKFDLNLKLRTHHLVKSFCFLSF